MEFVHYAEYPISGRTGHGIGYYYTRYDPETGEGQGWFGSQQEVSYYFREKLRVNAHGKTVLMMQTCGKGQGCFWTGWME